MTVDDRLDRMEKIVEKLIDAQLETQSQLGLVASVVGQMRTDLASIKSEQQELRTDVTSIKSEQQEQSQKLNHILERLTGGNA
jgi:chromosome segregation ATPase